MPDTVPFAAARDAAQRRDSLPRRGRSSEHASRVLLDEALELASRLGLRVVEGSCGSVRGGVSFVRGRKHLVIDPYQGAAEKLAWVATALGGDPRLAITPMSAPLSDYLAPRRAA